MSEDRIHRISSGDGTEIAARVHGHGPPLVFVHGGLGDDHVGWATVVPWLTGQFTCYTMSTRGRGLSEHSTDFSPERVVQDVVAVVESLGEPAGLVGHINADWPAASGRCGPGRGVSDHDPVSLRLRLSPGRAPARAARPLGQPAVAMAPEGLGPLRGEVHRLRRCEPDRCAPGDESLVVHAHRRRRVGVGLGLARGRDREQPLWAAVRQDVWRTASGEQGRGGSLTPVVVAWTGREPERTQQTRPPARSGACATRRRVTSRHRDLLTRQGTGARHRATGRQVGPGAG